MSRNDALQKLLQEKVAFVKINAATPEGGRVANTYGASGVPYFVLATAGGRPIASWSGYYGPKNFTEKLEASLARLTPPPASDAGPSSR